MAKNGTEVTVAKLPDCDMCKSEHRAEPNKASYDAKLKGYGQWAFICEEHKHWMAHDELGLGKGQRLVVSPKD